MLRYLVPVLQDDWGVEEVVNRVSVKANDLSSHPAESGTVVLWIIKVRVELFHQSHIDPLLQKSCKHLVPSAPPKFLEELIEHPWSKLNIPLQKDVPKLNVILVPVPSNLGSETGRVPVGRFPRCGHGSAFAGSHLKNNKNKKQQKQTAVSKQRGAKSNQNRGAISKEGVKKVSRREV